MTHTIDENVVRRMAELEEGLSVTAGSLNTDAFYRRVERHRVASHEKESPFVSVLGQFLNLARRDRSLTLEQLAEQIGGDPIELLLVEEGKKVPEPQIVSRLARCLEVAPGRLMQLAGHVQALDEEVVSAAYAFAARSNCKPLDAEERDALNEFVKALASR